MYYCMKICVLIFFHIITTQCWLSVEDDDDATASLSSYEIYERLKAGDQQAWEEVGPEVVDVVNQMIENGEAKSPVHALLRLFWPELTADEQTQTLAKVEPLVRSLYNDLWNVNGDNAGLRSSRFRKRRSATTSKLLKRNA